MNLSNHKIISTVIVLISINVLITFQMSLPSSKENEVDLITNATSLHGLKTNLDIENSIKYYKNLKQNPEELGVYFEGDIKHPMTLLRNGLISQRFRWKDGIVPIELRGDFSLKEVSIINTAFEMYHNLTCIKFTQRSNENDFVTITKKPTGCWSSLGRTGGQQILNLQSPICLLKVGTTLHELMHVLGFYHEHTRDDRDEYVNINWKNIKRDDYKNFGKSPPNTTYTFELKYDYESILHYSPFAFAMDSSKPTIVSLEKIGLEKMGQRNGLSKVDIDKIWKMYKCRKTTRKELENKANDLNSVW